MRPLGLALVALAAVATGCLLWGSDDPPTAAPAPTGVQPLAASVVSQPNACSLCHYAWDVPLDFNGSVEETAGGVRYRMSLAPSAAYSLADVRVVPVYDGDESASLVRLPASGTVTRGQETTVPLHLAQNASALHVLLTAGREFGRSNLSLELSSETGEATLVGIGSVRAATLAPEGGLPAGMYAARIVYADGTPPSEAFAILADAAPPGARVVPLATQEEPARFDFILAKRPRGFAVQLRPHNEHPTDKWYLPNWGDRGEVALFVSEGAPSAPRAWSAAEIGAAWAAGGERVFHDSSQDGVLLRTQDARGEWTRQQRWVVPPAEEQPFPPLPPGTREVVAEVTWSGRTPLSPTATPYFGWSSHLQPTFYYPQPETDEPGRRVYRIPIPPEMWQGPGETGGFQGFALLPLDAQRTTVHDGSYGVKLIAVR